jgi:hypothetical protein
MPYKANEPYRKKFKKAKYRVKNWKSYNEALRRRGDITVWFDDASLCAWYSTEATTRGRPQYYSDTAIQCCLILRQVYHLPLRQTQGFVCSLMGLMALDLDVPDYSTLSKRGISLEMARLIDTIEPGSHVIIDSTGLKVYGKDEWHQEKHCVQAKRTWRKLHLAVDEKHQIVACELTDKSVGDPTAAKDLLAQIDHCTKMIADGAYDTHGVYAAIRELNADADIVIPPGIDAVTGNDSDPHRNQHIQTLKKHSRIWWQKLTDYGKQAYAELAMLRYKIIFGAKMKAREIARQKTEAQVSVRVLNRMTGLGMPISVKV